MSQTNLRFFHDADAPAAADVAALLAAPLAGAAPTVRDFTHFVPAPAAGAIELWIAGEPPASAAAPPAPPRIARSPAPAEPTRDDAEAREIRRILAERAVEQMVRDAMR